MDRTANVLGALGLAVADRIEETARNILNRSGETPAALVVIGYGLGPTNDQLRHILGLSHPGTVRLVDRLVSDGLVERRAGRDKRAIALHLTARGAAAREKLLQGRLSSLTRLLAPLSNDELETFDRLLRKLLSELPRDDLDRCRLCRLCDDRVCSDCPIPADFKS
jgi:DNA-binding MarR family transcriptional regulator